MNFVYDYSFTKSYLNEDGINEPIGIEKQCRGKKSVRSSMLGCGYSQDLLDSRIERSFQYFRSQS